MNKLVLVVMAAGMGSRYGGLKQLEPIDDNGHVILDYSVYDARRAGFETVIFVIKQEHEELFREKIGDRMSKVMEVKYAFQRSDDLPEGYSVPEGRTKPWGTSHAVLCAKDAIDGAPFAVINADDYYGKEAYRKIYDFLETARDEFQIKDNRQARRAEEYARKLYECVTLERENIDEIKEELGFDDNLIVKGELYHLWAIGGRGYEEVQRQLPLDKAGLHVLFMPSIKQFRDKKVRILNGSHTGMVPIGLQLGCETVMDAFNNADLEQFINAMVAEEVIPMIEGDRAELQEFASGILERFYNPYIRHMLKSISLNSLSKWEARNYPTLIDNWQKAGKVAEKELFTFAALLTLYSGKVEFEPNDTAEHVEFIQKVWNNDDIPATVKAIVENRDIWTVDLTAVTPLVERVAEYVKDILDNGMAAALKRML